MIIPAESGWGLVVRYEEGDRPVETFTLPILAWEIDGEGFGEAIVATIDTIQRERHLRDVKNWTLLDYHHPVHMPNEAVG